MTVAVNLVFWASHWTADIIEVPWTPFSLSSFGAQNRERTPAGCPIGLGTPQNPPLLSLLCFLLGRNPSRTTGFHGTSHEETPSTGVTAHRTAQRTAAEGGCPRSRQLGRCHRQYWEDLSGGLGESAGSLHDKGGCLWQVDSEDKWIWVVNECNILSDSGSGSSTYVDNIPPPSLGKGVQRWPMTTVWKLAPSLTAEQSRFPPEADYDHLNLRGWEDNTAMGKQTKCVLCPRSSHCVTVGTAVQDKRTRSQVSPHCADHGLVSKKPAGKRGRWHRLGKTSQDHRETGRRWWPEASAQGPFVSWEVPGS